MPADRSTSDPPACGGDAAPFPRAWIFLHHGLLVLLLLAGTVHAVLASALSHLDRLEEAQSEIAAARAQKPDLTLSYIVKSLPTKPPGNLTTYLDGLRRIGLGD